MIVLSIPENNVNFLQRMVVDVVLSWLHNAIVIFRFNRVMSYSATFLAVLKHDFSSSVFFFLWFFPQKNSGNEKCIIFPFDSLSPNLVGTRSESERLWKFHVDTCQRTFPTSSYPPFAQKLMRFLPSPPWESLSPLHIHSKVFLTLNRSSIHTSPKVALSLSLWPASHLQPVDIISISLVSFFSI